jgi:hypothetical protein
LVETLSPDNARQTTYVSYAGKITNYAGASITRLSEEGWSAPLQTAQGLTLVSAKGSVRVRLPGITEVRLANEYGTALVRASGVWYTIQHESNGSKATVNRLTLPPGVAAVSLYSSYGPTPHYAWIDKFGQVGFSGSKHLCSYLTFTNLAIALNPMQRTFCQWATTVFWPLLAGQHIGSARRIGIIRVL